MSTVAGSGGGAALGGASAAPPPSHAPPELPLATAAESGERALGAAYCARLPALIATLSSPDREIVLLRVVAGVSVPDVVAALGVTPSAVRRAQQQALAALRPVAIANGPPPATRQRVVLLPHAPAEHPHARPDNGRTGRVTGMNQDDSLRQHPAQADGNTRAITANTQWHDAELAMKVAQHSVESWLVAGHEDVPSLALMHAHHAHTALHEASRAIITLIETFRLEAAALITDPADRHDIPTQRW